MKHDRNITQKKGGFMSDVQFIIWRVEYSVKVDKLDSQHREIFEMINRLHWSIKENQQAQVVGTILSEMTGYMYSHFKDEESLMLECQYPGLRVHKESHEAFKKRTHELILKHERTFYGDIASEVLEFLKTWWVSHILAMDKRYIPYLNKGTIN